MTFDPITFPAVVALLWLPIPANARRGSGRTGSPAEVSLGGMLRAWQNWADLTRSAGATFALLHLSIFFDPQDPSAATTAFLLQAGVLAAGVLAQIVRFSPELSFYGPLFYLTGLTAILPGNVPGGFALILGWVFAVGARDIRYMLPATAAALLLAGFTLGSGGQRLLLCAGLIVAPALLAVIFRQRLCYVSRSGAESKAGGGRLKSFAAAPRPTEATLALKPKESAVR
jgi:hypothetical protein